MTATESVQYRPKDPLTRVRGVGPSIASALAAQDIHTVQDLLLALPLRYEDRSVISTIAEAPLGEPVTILAEVKKLSHFFRPGRSITQATIADASGTLKCYWFNSPFIRTKLKEGQTFCFAGKVTLHAKTHKPVFSQPVVESLSADTIHTGRIVPLYTQTLELKQGSLRRILKEITDHLAPWQNITGIDQLTPLDSIFKTLHFPDTAEAVIAARERLALEELLSVIHKATELKTCWQSLKVKAQISVEKIKKNQEIIPETIPFQLTPDQLSAVTTILADLAQPHPMNRLLMGDVGSGKTVVAGVAAYWTVRAGQSAAFVAPTQILAEQHFQTLQKILPDLPITLLTSATTIKQKNTLNPNKPQLYLGTHAVLNQLAVIQPALVIYDEQHRFGVKHRSPGWDQTPELKKLHPHLLTMTATPIPRSLMLSLFAHLTVSTLSQTPHAKIPTKTWVVPERKRSEALDWMYTQLTSQPGVIEQGLLVCPFINPSETAGFETVAAATQTFEEVKAHFQQVPEFNIALLHSGLKPAAKKQIIEDLFAKKIQLLVTTPIVEVGVDLPAAKLICIEAAERFGLASLHQLRGRVGRAGQESYCLLFTKSRSPETKQRLEAFSKEHNGLKLAELDLERRGAGDLFGTAQHGFDELRFASWTNLTLIDQARRLFRAITEKTEHWEPLFQRESQATAVAAN